MSFLYTPKLSGWSKRTSALLRVNPVLEYVAFHRIGEVKSLPLLKRLSVFAQFGYTLGVANLNQFEFVYFPLFYIRD